MIRLALLASLVSMLSLAPSATLRLPDGPAIVGVLMPVEVTVRDAGRAIPEGPLEGRDFGAFEVVGRPSVESAGDGAYSVRFVLLPTRPGELALPSFELSLSSGGAGGAGTTRVGAVRVAETPVSVQSALAPGEEPKLRDTFALEEFAEAPSFLRRIGPYALAAALLGCVAFVLLRRRPSADDGSRTRVAAAPSPDPAALALTRLRALRAAADANGAGHADEAALRSDEIAEAADVVRRYLDRQPGDRVLTRTTEELAPFLEREAATAAVGGLLVDAELAKFAGRRPTRQRRLDGLDGAIAWLEARPRRELAP